MGLEDLTGSDKFIDDFNLSWPDGSADQVLTLDNHIFGIKNVLPIDDSVPVGPAHTEPGQIVFSPGIKGRHLS